MPWLVMACRAALHTDLEQQQQAAAMGAKQAVELAICRVWSWCSVGKQQHHHRTCGIGRAVAALALYHFGQHIHTAQSVALGQQQRQEPGKCYYAGAAFSRRLELLLAAKPSATHTAHCGGHWLLRQLPPVGTRTVLMGHPGKCTGAAGRPAAVTVVQLRALSQLQVYSGCAKLRLLSASFNVQQHGLQQSCRPIVACACQGTAQGALLP